MDAGLARRCRVGDPEAFSELVETTGSLTYRWAHRLAGNREDALDLVQEAYAAVWQALPGLREPESFRPWFLQVVGNAYRDWLRRRRRVPMVMPELMVTAEAPGPRPDDAAVLRDTREAVQAAVRSLPPTYAVTVSLHYLEGMGYRELAAALGVSVRTVETRLRRAAPASGTHDSVRPGSGGGPNAVPAGHPGRSRALLPRRPTRPALEAQTETPRSAAPAGPGGFATKC